jgi:hypothetical protein
MFGWAFFLADDKEAGTSDIAADPANALAMNCLRVNTMVWFPKYSDSSYLFKHAKPDLAQRDRNQLLYTTRSTR